MLKISMTSLVNEAIMFIPLPYLVMRGGELIDDEPADVTGKNFTNIGLGIRSLFYDKQPPLT